MGRREASTLFSGPTLGQQSFVERAAVTTPLDEKESYWSISSDDVTLQGRQSSCADLSVSRHDCRSNLKTTSMQGFPCSLQQSR
jgi:hypothetical protein